MGKETKERLQGYIQEGARGFSSGQPDKAESVWNEGLAFAEEMGDETYQAHFLGNLGILLGQIGRRTEAFKNFEKALDAYRRHENWASAGRLLCNRASLWSALGENRHAVDELQEALELFERVDDLAGKAGTLNALAAVWLQRREAKQAHKEAKQALELHQRLNDQQGQASDLTLQAAAKKDLGDWEEARDLYEKALTYGEKADVGTRVSTLGGLGIILESMGQSSTALIRYEKAFSIAKKARQYKLATDMIANMGSLHLREALRERNVITQDDSSKWDEMVESRQKRFSERIGHAHQFLEQALGNYHELKDRRCEADTLSNLGVVYWYLGDLEKALKFYEKGLRKREELAEVTGAAFQRTNMAGVYAARNDHQQAIREFNKAASILEDAGEITGAAFSNNGLGWTYLKQGRLNKARAALEKSALGFETIRARLRTEASRRMLTVPLPDVYENLAHTCLADGDEQGAYEVIQRGRARTFLDLLASRTTEIAPRESDKETATLKQRLRNLDQQISSQPWNQEAEGALRKLEAERSEVIEELRRHDPRLGDLATIKAPDLSSIQNLLPENLTLVEYYHPGLRIVGGEKWEELWIFVITSNDFHLERVPVTQTKLTETIGRYRDLIVRRSGKRAIITKLAAHLHSWLVKPIEKRLTTPSLAIVPWKSMFGMPMASLAPEGGEPLIERYGIVLVPSAGIFRHLQTRSEQRRKRLVAVANPETGLVSVPSTHKQAAQLAGLFESTVLKACREATKTFICGDFKQELGSPDVIHFACHSIFDELPALRSYLALTPDNENDGRLHLEDLFDLDWRGVSLVSMASCFSGAGSLQAGEEFVGLTRGLFFAGAPSILCALWEAEENLATSFMLSFYQRYTEGQSKLDAFLQTQREIRAHPDYNHPYFWAVYTLWGDHS